MICGIPSCSFVGRASHLFRPFVRSRLKEAVNNTVLCGDNQEKIQSGSGKKWQYHNSDYFHECAQKGFLTEVGNIGSISWYKGGDHTKEAIQICGEKLVSKIERSDGTVEYRWKQNGECWDFLDAVGQCLAAHASMGFASQSIGKSSFIQRRQIQRPRYKIV